MEEDWGPACVHHRLSGRSRSCPQDMRTLEKPVRGITEGGCGERAAWRVCAEDQPPSQATPTWACLPAPSATLGRRGSGRVGGAQAPGLAPPPRPPIGRARASSHAACLLARLCKRRAPLVCSDLGTKFKDFKSTSWRLLRAAARRLVWPATFFLSSPPPPQHWSPSFAA
jgi:hypothetical protein